MSDSDLEIDDDLASVSTPQLSLRQIVATPKRKSVIWNFYSKLSAESSECNICKKQLKTPTCTTTTLIRHLDVHPVAKEQYQSTLKTSRPTEKPVKSDAGQHTLHAYAPIAKSKKDQITKAITEMIVMDMRPYTCVEDSGFVNLLKVACPGYVIPSRTTFSRNLVPDLYNNVRGNIQDTINKDIEHGVRSISLTTDGWKSQGGQCYLSLTCHYMNTDFNYQHFNLCIAQIDEAHTAVNLRKMVASMMDEWSLPHNDAKIPVYIVTDNARNITAALTNAGNSWTHRKCFAHTLQLAISDAKKNTQGVLPLLKKVRGIVGHFHSSDPARRLLHKTQEEFQLPRLDVVQDVETRWNSEYAMLSRLLDVRVPLAHIFADYDAVDSLTGSEWKLIVCLVQILKPIDEATTKSSGDKYPTTSMIIPLICGMLNSITTYMENSENAPVGKSFSQELTKAIKARFPLPKSDDIAANAMFVDPRFKLMLLNDIEQAKVVRNITLEIAEAQCEPSSRQEEIPEDVQGQAQQATHSTFWNFLMPLRESRSDPHVETVSMEVNRYNVDALIGQDANPYDWWRTNGQQKYPNVAKLATKYLPIPATSVSSERMFSTAGNVVTRRRVKLLPQHVRQLTFLHDNLKEK